MACGVSLGRAGNGPVFDFMAFIDMAKEIQGWMGSVPISLAKTLVNRSLEKIYETNNWSFQIQESGWFTPGEFQGGTITTTLGSNQIVGDATAQAVWNALPAQFPITQMQIRLPAYALYDVVFYNPGTGTLTIDRPWAEPSGTGQTFMLYQAYFTSPVQDFKRWLAVRDFTNAASLIWWEWKQTDLDLWDPQRTVYNLPDHVVPYKVDTRAGTSTSGWLRFELYPHQLAQLPYSLYFLRKGPTLVNNADTVPYPLSEKLVLSRARMLNYEYKEAQKGEQVARGSGADWKFLYQAANAEFQDEMKDIRKVDRDMYDQYIKKLRRKTPANGAPYYSSVTGQANVGAF